MELFQKHLHRDRGLPPVTVFARPWRRGFTLVEILVVITILAVVAGTASVLFDRHGDYAEDAIVNSEMRNLREAFNRFRGDCLPDAAALDEMRKFGLWPLLTRFHPGSGDNYTAYDPAQGTGWAGPYLEVEGERLVDDDPDRLVGRKTFGQETEPGGLAVPVILTPWQDAYRLMAPKNSIGVYKPSRLLVVSLGNPGKEQWNAGNERWEPLDMAAWEQDALSSLQPRMDYWLWAPEALSPAQTPQEALALLAAEFSSYSFHWLMPSDASLVP